MADQPLSLSNACGGVVEARFQEALERVVEHLHRDDLAGSKAEITIKIIIDGDAEMVRIAIGEPKITLPERKAIARLGRIKGGQILVDDEENDASGQRALFTPAPKP